MIKTRIFDKVDYFNESLFLYFVDIDFCYRLSDSKFKIVRVKSALLYHEEGKKEKNFYGKQCIMIITISMRYTILRETVFTC